MGLNYQFDRCELYENNVECDMYLLPRNENHALQNASICNSEFVSLVDFSGGGHTRELTLGVWISWGRRAPFIGRSERGSPFLMKP